MERWAQLSYLIFFYVYKSWWVIDRLSHTIVLIYVYIFFIFLFGFPQVTWRFLLYFICILKFFLLNSFVGFKFYLSKNSFSRTSCTRGILRTFGARNKLSCMMYNRFCKSYDACDFAKSYYTYDFGGIAEGLRFKKDINFFWFVSLLIKQAMINWQIN